MKARLVAVANGRMIPLAAVLLMAIRFSAPSTSAALGVQGVDTRGLDAFFLAYTNVLPLAAAFLASVVLLAWPRGFGWGEWLLVAGLLTLDVVFWLGEVDRELRLAWGPLATLPLGLGVTATILAYGMALEARLRRVRPSEISRDGFRALYGGFALAYFLGSLRFIDYQTVLGAPLPSGMLWFLNNGPILVLSAISLAFWLMLAVRPASGVAGALLVLALPVLGALTGIVFSQGLGGFILSNFLAWGGSYGVFVPTSISLGLVGFAVGAFLATAWTLRSRLGRPAWWFITCGVSTTALAGIQAFGGTLASLAGILLGLTLAARGLSWAHGPQPMPG